MAKNVTRILILVLVLGMMVPGTVRAEAATAGECFILIGGDNDNPKNMNNLLFQHLNDGQSLYDAYSVMFIDSEQTDKSQQVQKQIQSMDYSRIVLAAYSRGGLSVANYYDKMDERIQEVILIDAISNILGSGICGDQQMAAEWFNRVLKMAVGRHIIIIASNDERGIALRSRMLIKMIEEKAGTHNLIKLSDGEYAINDKDGNVIGTISTSVVGDVHGKACINAFPYIWNQLKQGSI